MAIFDAELGQVVRIGKQPAPILVKDAAGTLVNPATITITAKRPDGTTSTPATPSHYLDDSGQPIIGTFFYDYEPPRTGMMAGRHYWEILTTAPDSELKGTIYFSPSRFVP